MPVIILDHCTGCGACVASCQSGAITLQTDSADGFGRKKAVVSFPLCLSCGACILTCHHHAIEFASGFPKKLSKPETQ